MNTQYGIVGSGPAGRTLAGLFARAGIDVQIANSRGPESMAAIATELGRHVVPVTVEQALDADVIFLAVGFLQVPVVTAKRSDWTGKLVVDVTNTLQSADRGGMDLGGLLSSEINAQFVAGAKLVKAFKAVRWFLRCTNDCNHVKCSHANHFYGVQHAIYHRPQRAG